MSEQNLEELLLRMRYDLTALQAKLSDALGIIRAHGLADVAATSSGHRITGIRFVRGTHSGYYVRDPHGTDRLPAGHEEPPP